MPYIYSLGEWVDLFKHNICFILYSTKKKTAFSPNPSHDDQNTEESVDLATWLGPLWLRLPFPNENCPNIRNVLSLSSMFRKPIIYIFQSSLFWSSQNSNTCFAFRLLMVLVGQDYEKKSLLLWKKGTWQHQDEYAITSNSFVCFLQKWNKQTTTTTPDTWTTS